MKILDSAPTRFDRIDRSWPARRERRPSFFNPYYLHYTALAASLTEARDRYVQRPARVLDVGCGRMPYYPIFEAVASDYVGSDITPGPRIRHVCPVEDLDVGDGRYDLVLCTQVIEHVADPDRALAEIARVLRPGGHAFITTHGVWPYHPYPTDYRRWTQQGLEDLVARTENLTLVELVPHRGTAACLALLASFYLDVVVRRGRSRRLGSALIGLVNAAGLLGERLDHRFVYPNQDTLIHNFLVVARRSDGGAG
jgi:SAM-dependent methyltransferase